MYQPGYLDMSVQSDVRLRRRHQDSLPARVAGLSGFGVTGRTPAALGYGGYPATRLAGHILPQHASPYPPAGPRGRSDPRAGAAPGWGGSAGGAPLGTYR